MCPSPVPEGQRRGYVVPIGGGEDKTLDTRVLSRFVDICGGGNASIAVIPTASQLQDTGDIYCELFRNLGAREAQSLPLEQREDAENPEYLNILDKADGVFITGGNQLRLSTILGGTAIFQKLRRLNASGLHIAGTSAGAAIVPEHMIVGGATGLVPIEGGVNLAPGLGLTNAMIIDQHFSQRNRLGRLLAAVSYNPFLLGLGLDEDTGAFIDADNQIAVVGSGSITLIDASELSYSSMAEARGGDALSMLGLKLHFLAEGATFNINTREPSPPPRSS